mmetsp:Transcript_12960/g.19744  ORF Transcript_12960/g.19744 Transcript_12960/m.19744 type:complete len:487 (+) Transcript_12960:64-1524(+)
MNSEEGEASSLAKSIVAVLSDQTKGHAKSILKFMEAADIKRRSERVLKTTADDNFCKLDAMNTILDYADLLLRQHAFLRKNIGSTPMELAGISELIIGVWKERQRFFHGQSVEGGSTAKSAIDRASSADFHRMFGTMASLYNTQASEVKEKTESIAMLNFATTHALRGLCRYLIKLYDARSLKLKTLGGDMLKAGEDIFGSLLAMLSLVVRAQALEFQNLLNDACEHEIRKPPGQSFSHEGPIDCHLREVRLSSKSSVLLSDQIEQTSIQSIPKQIKDSVEDPLLRTANVKGPTIQLPTDEVEMIEFTSTLMRRESNDLQIMAGIDLPDLRQFQEGIYLLVYGLKKIGDGLATLKHDFITKDTIDIILGLRTIFEYKRNDMRKYGETLQGKGEEQKYFGDIIKLDAVVNDKIGKNLEVLLESDGAPQIIDMVKILRDGYKERVEGLQKSADFLARRKQFDLCKIVRRMADLMDHIVAEIDALIADR